MQNLENATKYICSTDMCAFRKYCTVMFTLTINHVSLKHIVYLISFYYMIIILFQQNVMMINTVLTVRRIAVLIVVKTVTIRLERVVLALDGLWEINVIWN